MASQVLKTENIGTTLKRLGLIRDDRVKIFSKGTRDRKDLTVYRDDVSQVIFIDDYYIGEAAYESGAYREEFRTTGVRELEDYVDCSRRFESYKQFTVGKDICDFGCGYGSFLRSAQAVAKSVCGVEIQQDCIEQLKLAKVPCVDDLSKMPDELDTVFLFHSFEHFPNPMDILNKLKKKLKPGGRGTIVLEVPHARDFLISGLEIQEFVDFTLWSQHLLLHTRESLRAFLQDAGFKSIVIEGVQRHGLSNHFNWLKRGKPGGHKLPLSVFETNILTQSYAEALAKIDANDTLVAIATT